MSWDWYIIVILFSLPSIICLCNSASVISTIIIFIYVSSLWPQAVIFLCNARLPLALWFIMCVMEATMPLAEKFLGRCAFSPVWLIILGCHALGPVWPLAFGLPCPWSCVALQLGLPCPWSCVAFFIWAASLWPSVALNIEPSCPWLWMAFVFGWTCRWSNVCSP